MDWPSSANDDAAQGRIGQWVKKVLTPESAKIWAQIDPTNRELVAFVTAYTDAGGIAPGESQPS